jgi:ketosteroid isomerase-like protein
MRKADESGVISSGKSHPVHDRYPYLPLIATALLLAGCASTPAARRHSNPAHTPTTAAGAGPTEQVIAAERAFAKSMADRDFGAFAAMLSSEAIFFNGNAVMHGTSEIAAGWQPYFKGAKAPFSWQPDHVEVLPSGKLALSTGPVYIAGQVVGRFNSIWRLEGNGNWRIVFDKGEAVCDTSPPGQPDFSRLSP